MDPLTTWREKLEHLEGELAIASDAAAKFTLKKQIEEANAKIADLEVGRAGVAVKILKDNIVEAPPKVSNPGTLLSARYQVVPFFDEIRQREMQALESWRDDGRPGSVRLFFGPGGAGNCTF